MLQSCNLDAVGICNPVLGSRTIVLSAKPLLLPDTDTIQQRLLVIVMDYSSCALPATMNQTAIRTIFLGNNGDGSGGVAQKYTQCSHGKFNLNTTAFKVITVRSNCTDAVSKSCSYWRIADDGDIGARALLGKDKYYSFTHFAYVLPEGMIGRCPWSGLALSPGQQIWLQSSSYGVNRWATIMQEALHNYGLWHSWQNGQEYEDYSTFMGRGDVCLNAPEMAYMGWATPAPGGGSINSNALPVGMTLTFNLPATYLTPEGNYLRVIPDWLPSYNTSTQAKNLYIALRASKGADSALTSFYASKLNIHEVNAKMDSNPLFYMYMDRRISFFAATAPQTRMNITSYNLVVYAGSWINTDILRVHLCRFMSSAKECPTLRAAEEKPQLPPPNLPSPRRSVMLPPPPRATTNNTMPTTVDVSGTLIFKQSHSNMSEWVIRKSDGSVLPIARGYQPPKADNLGQVVVPGALVVIVSYVLLTLACGLWIETYYYSLANS
ncbi:metalloproteinase, extracellular matrix glycoprotein VMP13 [Volvox carteri f. nagariensis]|uniref:Metalloproteinase, extracellular matrix glycoprotein VMP13 n=1 Tax=Volvox carteri f. nagariensis TaxID=3068 RepID=D8UBM1_VOLCA|nr:metalloproteinase, extracellular matrix glycoprotein VMP13 [Volvox carteri f. nagariensis]EFJ42792.1 metalloproteinase, extracellular matrix glycoprotein VMP13 [Volvox carteri f. nagariensis]|eukprot:XP_002956052.1 metalloproteinase, extracellular matrix glycoprotein VMP13 [Volvox carteri f. nagariensis]